MKPPAFDYLAPGSLDEALEALSKHGGDAKILAGGQSLVPVLNFRLAQPAVLIDLNGIEELSYIQREDDGGLGIGAMTRQRTVERDAQIAEIAPLLAEAMPLIAHPQIRNRGTIGGSLAHADPAGELPVAAVALEAVLVLKSTRGSREVAAADFFEGLMTTSLEPDEVLCEVRLPPAPARTGWSFREIARRHGDYASAGVAVRLTLGDDGRIAQTRLVYLSAGEVPMVAKRAGALLEGHEPTEEKFAEAASLAATEEVDPSNDIHASAEFKRHLVDVLTRRGLADALTKARAAR